MLKFFKNFKKPQPDSAEANLQQGLKKTRRGWFSRLSDLFLGKKTLDADLLEELETQLLEADIGIEATQQIIADLTQRISRKELNDADALMAQLHLELKNILLPCQLPLAITGAKPYVILMVGINGAGKTTTIGKLAKQLQNQGKKVLLAAGDTFRAAAVEQLQTWGQRNDVPVISQPTGADSAAVIFDALQAARARNIDVVIADTAGRLHTQHNLMEELKKVVRVIKKIDLDAPHEVMLILDSGTGQNALQQAKQFTQAVNVTGITLTKLDGTAKGGIIFAIAKQLNLPIRFIGVGEKIDDLQVFNAEQFVDAILGADDD